MAEERVTFVFEAKGGDQTSQQMKGVASALAVTQRDADKAAKELRDLRKYLEFTKGTNSADKLKKKMDEFPAIMTKIRGLTKNLKDKEIKGLAGAFTNLTAAEQKQIDKLNQLYPAVQKTRGITAAFKNGVMGAVPALGMMATGAGAVTVVFQKIINVMGRAVDKVNEFIRSSIKLGAEQEEGRAIMIGLIGDIEAGTAAYDAFDKRVTDSPFKREIYSMEEYAAAVGTGMGNAYLDAAEAGNRFNFTGKSFVENIYKMERGLLRSVNTLGQFGVVMEKAGFTVDEIRDGTLSYADAADLMKKAVHELAEEQRDMAGTIGTGTLNLIKNYWYDIKEDVGELLLKYMKPMGRELFKTLKDIRSMKDLWHAVAMVIKGLAPVVGTGILVPLKSIVVFMRIFNALAERTAAAWRVIAAAMGRAVPEEGPKTTNIGAYMTTYDRGPSPSIAPGSGKGFLFGEDYWDKKFTEGGGGGGGAKSISPAEYRARKLGMTLEQYNALQAGPGFGMIEPTAAPSFSVPGRREIAALDESDAAKAKRQKDMEKRYGKVAKKTGDLMADFFQASLKEGGLGAFFKNLGAQVASTIISALAGAAIFQALMMIATGGTGGGGGFFSMFGQLLGFEQEGSFTNITSPRAVLIHPGEAIFNQDTVSALRAGGMPRGGRPGYEYGPETYGGAGSAPVTNVYNIIRPGVNAEIETYRMSERGRAFAEMLDG